VVNTSTGLVIYGGAGQSNYVAAKAGALSFTEAIATEMAPYGVTANCIMPSGATRLAAIGWRMERGREDVQEMQFDRTDPVHVAEMVCYLASPGAGWISGQTFQVRGGVAEHVQTYTVDRTIHRDDRGWTAVDYAQEIPRMFGAGSHKSDPPPKDWTDKYHSKGTATTTPN
jgi:hypothetical protein